MNCQRAREIFPELLDSRTAATAHLDARTHLAGCPDCQRDFATLSRTADALDSLPASAPSPRLRRNFYALLEEEKNSAASVRAAAVRPRRTSAWRWVLAPLAGAALVVAGFVAGQRTAAPAASAPTIAQTDAASRRELEDLRRKVDTMGQLVGYSLLQQQQRPANDRLRGVVTSALSADEHPNDRVINELISALALDPSVNVRLRALDGLFPLADREVVRAGVLASLPREQNPIVQVSMIDFLASARDAEARPALEKLVLNDGADASVRTAARRALTQL
ncbi:MAG: hypothetical protein B9S34_15845 [Opitutia bacterium Tous-C1TDCM]|nr:MAG: hypothetical protein B9S34_15845 [Opitutae bacterium Tous-C1TDCM]